jgi:hypothetical protein
VYKGSSISTIFINIFWCLLIGVCYTILSCMWFWFSFKYEFWWQSHFHISVNQFFSVSHQDMNEMSSVCHQYVWNVQNNGFHSDIFMDGYDILMIFTPMIVLYDLHSPFPWYSWCSPVVLMIFFITLFFLDSTWQKTHTCLSETGLFCLTKLLDIFLVITWLFSSLWLNRNPLTIYVYLYVYICTYICVYIYIYECVWYIHLFLNLLMGT